MANYKPYYCWNRWRNAFKTKVLDYIEQQQPRGCCTRQQLIDQFGPKICKLLAFSSYLYRSNDWTDPRRLEFDPDDHVYWIEYDGYWGCNADGFDRSKI